jgi:hypothetical protein
VYTNNGDFIMNGGSISGNTASSSFGGGVRVSGSGGRKGTFTMNGGNIGGNTSTTGGGVYVDGTNGDFTMMNGGSISGNTASIHGGGVYGDFTMNGGNIGGNTAPNGGGVYTFWEFTMNGGSISGNTASANGGGVYVNSNDAFTMSDDAAVNTNNQVYLNNTVITLSGTLTKNPAANIVPSNSSPGTQALSGDITAGDNYKKFWLNGVSNENGDKIDSDGTIK